MIMIDDWKPISTAPSGETILLAWDDGGDDYDFLFSEGELEDGLWLDGPNQPDWWMYCPVPPSKRRHTADDFRTLAALPSDEAHAGTGSMLAGVRNPGSFTTSELMGLPWEMVAFLFHTVPSVCSQSFLSGFNGIPIDRDDPPWLSGLNHLMRVMALLSGLCTPVLIGLMSIALLSGKLTFMAPVAVLGIYVGACGTLGFLVALREIWLARRRARGAS